MHKTALVIGASRGIGKEIVSQLSEIESLEVFGMARSLSNEDEGNIHFRTLDLEDPNLKANLNAILAEVDKIDYLINNAGKIVVKPFLELTKEDIEACYQVNVVSVMETIQVCIPKMKKGGHIVNISSIGGFQGSLKFAGLSAYSTSKAAVVSLTELLAEEFKDSGIAINCLCLGSVQTEMLEEAFPGYRAPLSATEMAEYIVGFTLTAGKYMHGSILPVSLTNP